ncbi:MAG: NUMOD4 domain-containing protein [Peptostreptococcaceae bacterium]
MQLYLYDPRYNLKTETDYIKIIGLCRVTGATIDLCINKDKKISSRYYVIDESFTKKEIRNLYEKEVFKDEHWKEIEGSEGEFLISNYGRFKRIYNKYPKGKFLLPYFSSKRSCNKHKQHIKVKFKGVYREYPVARLVAYHFVDIYYTSDSIIKKSKDPKYKKYTYNDVSAYHKNGLMYDNYVGNLEWLDKQDVAKKTAHKSKTKGTIVAIDVITGEIIDYFRSTREVEKNLYISRQAVSDSLNNKWKTNVACGTYIFKYDE